MISVGSRDGRKGLDLGFGGGGGAEMEETELEEGEACSYQNNEDYDASIDPDVALSYIDEKLQDVLGHFQKDFEGGVSAENLGAKFGGYGSFLPTYQRSPAWPHPKTPPKVHNYNIPRSPHNLLVEGGRSNSQVSSTAPQSVRLGSSSTSTAWLPAAKAPSMNDSINQEVCEPAIHTEAFISKYESVNKKPTDMFGQKPLKVRIKMGTDNLSTRKNAAIYSGLGLDVSPSSSLDYSPSESDGISREPQDAPLESPTSILQIMTSFPVLLSPLPDDVIHLTEKEMHEQDSIFVAVPRDDMESSGTLVHGSNFAKGERKVSGGKKRSLEMNYLKVRGGNNKDVLNEIRDKSKKGPNVDALTCEELVSETLKLPILSNSYSAINNSTKGIGRPCDILSKTKNGVLREKAFSDEAQETQVEPTSMEEDSFLEKAKSATGGKAQDKDASFLDDSVCIVKDNQHDGEKTFESVMAESNVVKGRRAPNAEVNKPPRKSYQGISCEQDSTILPAVKEHSFPGEKKKYKESHIHGAVVVEGQKESLKLGSSFVSKIKKNCDVDSYTSNIDTDPLKEQKDHGKARDRYRDFFGELVNEEDRMESSEMPHEDSVKDSEVVEKSTPPMNGELRERSSDKKLDKPSTSHLHTKTLTNGAWCTGNGSVDDVGTGKGVPITVAPVVVEDQWVLCDKCEKWRLLPVGTNTDDLPEKWLCSMLNWLPNMNRCSVSQYETTTALIAQYQAPAPAPESQTNLQNITGNVLVEGTLSTVQHPDQYHQNYSLHAMDGGKKKLGKEVPNPTNKDGSLQLSNLLKKNLQSSLKSRSFNDVNESPLLSESDVQQLRKSSDLAGEKHKNKQKVLDNHSDRGDAKNLKVKNRRDPDQVCSEAAKKIMTEEMQFTDGDFLHDQDGTSRNVSHSSGRSFPSTSAAKDWPKHKHHSSDKDSVYDANDMLQVSVKNLKDNDQGSVDEFLDKGKTDARDSGKKRMFKEYQDSQTNLGSHHSTGHLHESRDLVKEEFSENDCREEKKARISKSDGKESSTSKGSGRTDKKSSHKKNQKLGQDLGSSLSQRSLDGTDCLKRDLGTVQVSVAATSSSSKVSGSHRTKASLHEVKGSPVESVSSSPMRISKPDKFTLSNKELIGKDDSHDTRRCSDDGGSDRSGTAKKDKSFSMAHHRSRESSMYDFQDRENGYVSDTKPKGQFLPSPDNTTIRLADGFVDNVGQNTTCHSRPQILDQCRSEERPDDSKYCANGSHPRKSAKGSSSRSKDRDRSFKSEYKMKNSSSLNQLQDRSLSYEEKHRDGKFKLQENFKVESDGTESKNVGKRKDSALKLSNESIKRENRLSSGDPYSQEATMVANGKQDSKSAPSQNLLLDCDGERSAKRVLFERTDQGEQVYDREKSLPLPPAGAAQSDALSRCPLPASGSHKGNGDMAGNASKVDDTSKLQKRQIRNANHQNGTQHVISRHPTPNGHRTKGLDAPSPARRDSSCHAASNAVKEATDLKHLADRLKNSGSTTESTGLYFEAVLKFLHGASLYEASNNDNGQSKKMYSSTAKLCEFCAHEYERLKNMAAAALAYKCLEVIFMKVIYSSHTSASRDRLELQTALQMIPPGESPSSSASDVDNVNNTATADRVALPKGLSSPHVAGTHISARNRPNFMRLLNFAQDVSFSMEASRKSRIAFAAASASLDVTKHAEGISSIKRALDLNFQDVQGLLRLVRLAMEAINR